MTCWRFERILYPTIKQNILLCLIKNSRTMSSGVMKFERIFCLEFLSQCRCFQLLNYFPMRVIDPWNRYLIRKKIYQKPLFVFSWFSKNKDCWDSGEAGSYLLVFNVCMKKKIFSFIFIFKTNLQLFYNYLSISFSLSSDKF